MKTCDCCKKQVMDSDIFPFIARKTGHELHICEECLDGSMHDYFHNLVMKSRIMPMEVPA